MKKEIINQILYFLASIAYCAYLATRKSAFMFCGGLLLIAASIMLIKNKKDKQ